MQIRKQGKSLQLIRYYSVKTDDGKKQQKQSVITTVPPETAPDTIPVTVVNKLTPPELQQLRKFLARTAGEQVVAKLGELAEVIKQAQQLIAQDSTETELKGQLQDRLAALAQLEVRTATAQSAGK